MRRHAWTLFVSVVLLSIPSIGWTGAKEDVAAATAKWAELFSDDNPDAILALYDKEGVLWGTLSPVRRDDPAALRDYFQKAFVALPGHKVSFGNQLIRVYGDAAVNTGYYTFSYVKDGETKSFPARYSFTYVKKGNNWMIVDNHSAAMPPPPKK